MVSNYRKSPGRFGEIGNEVGIERPPVRPSIAFPNAKNVLDALGAESATPSIGKSDSTPTTALYLSNTDADDMSSLGDDPSILEILFPASPMQVACDHVQPEVTNSQTTSPTMTTLMDLFHPTESTSRQLQCNTAKSEAPSEVVKKKKKKKKRSEDSDAPKKTKVGSDKKKSKDEISKTKKSKPKEDTKNTTDKKNESLDRKKKKASPSDPTLTPNEPTKKKKKKLPKSDESSPEVKLPVDKTHERKQKKSSKGEAVIPTPTCQALKSECSKLSKGKPTCREKSSSQNDGGPVFSRAKKDNNGNPPTNTQHRTLEFAIASIPKERAKARNPKVATKSKGPLLKRIFGESHSRQ